MHHRNGGAGGRGGGSGAGRKDKRGSLHQGSRKPRGDNKSVASPQRRNCGECRRSKHKCSSSEVDTEAVETDKAITFSEGVVSSRQQPIPCTNCEALQLHNQQLYESIKDVMVDWARDVGVDIDGDRDATASVDTEEMEWQREHVFIIPADHRKVTDSELLGLENSRPGLAAAGGLSSVGGGHEQLLAQPWGQVEALARPAPALQYHSMNIASDSSVLEQASQWLIRQGIMSPISEPSTLDQFAHCSSRLQLPPMDAIPLTPSLHPQISVPKSFVKQRF